MMPRWRVDFIGRGAKHLGTVEASNASDAVAKAAEEFNIPPSRQFKIVMTRIESKRNK